MRRRRSASLSRHRKLPAQSARQIGLWVLFAGSLWGSPGVPFPEAAPGDCRASELGEAKRVLIADAWSSNSINAVVFRHNSLVTRDGTQFVAFYDPESRVCLGKRTLGSSDWQLHTTQYRGNTADAHNSISLMVDGKGLLHMAWDHHGHPLNYVQGKEPGSLEMTERMPMTGHKEGNVTYPEFYAEPEGGLVFLYRDGGSGQGDLMMNRYDPEAAAWTQVQDAFVNGEGERNAYWQMCTDSQGAWHLSWVWRETGDVATNHDMAYACSKDGGRTWLRSDGDAYELPITQATAEYAARIPLGSELMNTNSMCADSSGHPYIATYFCPKGSKVPQYHVISHDGTGWSTSQISRRKTPFTLGGFGTKRIPLSRCQILVKSGADATSAYLLFRDEERGSRISLASTSALGETPWSTCDLTDESVGMWEPSYDTELWRTRGLLHVYAQHVGQGDGDTAEDIGVQPATVLEVQLR